MYAYAWIDLRDLRSLEWRSLEQLDAQLGGRVEPSSSKDVVSSSHHISSAVTDLDRDSA